MTSPDDHSPERIDLHKSGDAGDGSTGAQPAGGDAPLDFDPYRFGLPDHPIPPEYAPPGYVPPQPEPGAQSGSPYATGPTGPGYGQQGYGQHGPAGFGQHGPGTNPYGNPSHGWQQPGPTTQWPPPGPQPYGYPQPFDPSAGRRNHGKAVTAMVLGILSIVFCWLTFLDAVLIIPAVVFALITISDKRSSGRGMAIAGLICAVVGAVAAVALLIWLAPIAKDCSGLSGDQQQSCIRDHL